MAIREQDFVLHDQCCCSSGCYSRMSTDERVFPHYRSRVGSRFSLIANNLINSSRQLKHDWLKLQGDCHENEPQKRRANSSDRTIPPALQSSTSGISSGMPTSENKCCKGDSGAHIRHLRSRDIGRHHMDSHRHLLEVGLRPCERLRPVRFPHPPACLHFSRIACFIRIAFHMNCTGCAAKTTGGPACRDRTSICQRGAPNFFSRVTRTGSGARAGSPHMGVAVAEVVVGRVHRRAAKHASARAGTIDVIADAAPGRRRPHIASVVSCSAQCQLSGVDAPRNIDPTNRKFRKLRGASGTRCKGTCLELVHRLQLIDRN